MKIEGSGSVSGSISQRHGSADQDQDPDPHQNVMDPEHCCKLPSFYLNSREKKRDVSITPKTEMYRYCAEKVEIVK
jgi:hypothetical protein